MVPATVSPWQAHIALQSQVLDEDYGYREEGESDALSKPLDHPPALLGRAAVVCRQENTAPQPAAQSPRLPSKVL